MIHSNDNDCVYDDCSIAFLDFYSACFYGNIGVEVLCTDSDQDMDHRENDRNVVEFDRDFS